MASERNDLPGQPSNELIRQVRKTLWLYCHCRPQRMSRTWLMTWRWAAAICGRNESFNRVYGIKAKRKPWPRATEIASQYLFLCMMDMRQHYALGLPARASDCMTDEVKEHLEATSLAVAKVEGKTKEPIGMIEALG